MRTERSIASREDMMASDERWRNVVEMAEKKDFCEGSVVMYRRSVEM
jgi:hypothetical protein